jgi:hypothetical protein
MNMVGTPYNAVHFSCSIARSVASGSKPAGIDHGGAERDGGEVAHHHAEAVVERHRDADAILFGQAHGAAGEIAIVEDVVVGQRHTLRRSRGAAGELDVDGIVELQGCAEHSELLAMLCAAHARDFLKGNRAGCLRAADLDHDAQGRQPRRLQLSGPGARQLGQQRVEHLHVIAGLERSRGDDRGAADFLQREFQLAEPIGGIDRYQDQAGFGGGELGQRPFRTVKRPDADPLAAFKAKCEKACGERVDALGEFRPGPSHGVAGRDQRLATAPAAYGVIEAATDGVAEQRRVRDAANIAVGFICKTVRQVRLLKVVASCLEADGPRARGYPLPGRRATPRASY